MRNCPTTTRQTARPPASESNGRNPILAAAIAYRRRGWRVVPIPHGSKNPGDAYGKGWQDARLELDDLPRYFSSPIHLGVLLAEPSGGIVETDLDCRFARALALHFLPPTELRSGRPGSPNSHWWYKATGLKGSPAARTKRFQELGNDDPDKAGDPNSAVDERNVIVELRSTRGQTVAPPSIHPTGEAPSTKRSRACEEGDAKGSDDRLCQRG